MNRFRDMVVRNFPRCEVGHRSSIYTLMSCTPLRYVGNVVREEWNARFSYRFVSAVCHEIVVGVFFRHAVSFRSVFRLAGNYGLGGLRWRLRSELRTHITAELVPTAQLSDVSCYGTYSAAAEVGCRLDAETPRSNRCVAPSRCVGVVYHYYPTLLLNHLPVRQTVVAMRTEVQ